MAYRPDQAVALALLESAILTCGVALIALLNDLYPGTPIPPASFDAALARISPPDFHSFFIAVAFAFYVAWPLAACGAVLTQRIAGKARSLALPFVLMPFGIVSLAIATLLFGLNPTDIVSLVLNGLVLGFLCGLLAKGLLLFQPS